MKEWSYRYLGARVLAGALLTARLLFAMAGQQFIEFSKSGGQYRYPQRHPFQKMAASGPCRMPIRLPLDDFSIGDTCPARLTLSSCAEVLVEASVRKFVAYTATAALGHEHSAR